MAGMWVNSLGIRGDKCRCAASLCEDELWSEMCDCCEVCLMSANSALLHLLSLEMLMSQPRSTLILQTFSHFHLLKIMTK